MRGPNYKNFQAMLLRRLANDYLRVCVWSGVVPLKHSFHCPIANSIGQSLKTHNKTFLSVNPDLETVCASSLSLGRECLRLTYKLVIQFSSPATNCFRNGLIRLVDRAFLKCFQTVFGAILSSIVLRWWSVLMISNIWSTFLIIGVANSRATAQFQQQHNFARQCT